VKVEKNAGGGVTVVLEGKEVGLMRLTLERASFIDTPPDRQDEILRFAEDLLRALAPAPRTT
jgi:hypothetical protein